MLPPCFLAGYYATSSLHPRLFPPIKLTSSWTGNFSALITVFLTLCSQLVCGGGAARRNVNGEVAPEEHAKVAVFEQIAL